MEIHGERLPGPELEQTGLPGAGVYKHYIYFEINYITTRKILLFPHELILNCRIYNCFENKSLSLVLLTIL